MTDTKHDALGAGDILRQQFYLEANNPELHGSWNSLKIVDDMPYILNIKRIEHGDKNVDDTYKIDNKYHLHYCGYVGIPRFHPLYGKVNDFGGTSWIEEDGMERDNVLNVHGGITFTGYKRPWGTQFFFVGFDTAHYNDINDIEILESCIKHHDYVFMTHAKVKKEVKNLFKQVLDYTKINAVSISAWPEEEE